MSPAGSKWYQFLELENQLLGTPHGDLLSIILGLYRVTLGLYRVILGLYRVI